MLERTAGGSLGLDERRLRGLDPDARLEVLMSAMKSANLMARSAALSWVRRLVQVFTANLNTVYGPATPSMGAVYVLVGTTTRE